MFLSCSSVVVPLPWNFACFYDKGMPEREFMKSLHFMFGLCVLALVLLRLLAKRLSPHPEAAVHSTSALHWFCSAPRAVGSCWSCTCSCSSCRSLGWLMLSAAGKPIPFFGLELPALIAPDDNFGQTNQITHMPWQAISATCLIGLARGCCPVSPTGAQGPSCCNACVGVDGAAGGDRTHDPWLRRPILYPLSYSRIAAIVGVDVASHTSTVFVSLVEGGGWL